MSEWKSKVRQWWARRRCKHEHCTPHSITSWHPFQDETSYALNFRCWCGKEFSRRVCCVEAHQHISEGIPWSQDDSLANCGVIGLVNSGRSLLG